MILTFLHRELHQRESPPVFGLHEHPRSSGELQSASGRRAPGGRQERRHHRPVSSEHAPGPRHLRGATGTTDDRFWSVIDQSAEINHTVMFLPFNSFTHQQSLNLNKPFVKYLQLQNYLDWFKVFSGDFKFLLWWIRVWKWVSCCWLVAAICWKWSAVALNQWH